MQEETRVENLDKLIVELKPFLRRYLEERNVEINDAGKFKCINPDHKDEHPSCSLMGQADDTWFTCFSCGVRGNILNAANLIEDKPMSGREFITENVLYLADKYSVEHSEINITPEEITLRRTYRAYEDAADIIIQDYPIEYLTKRNWSVSMCKELRIGFVKTYADFISKMLARGYDREFCEEIDLNSHIFNGGMLIFSVRDEKGKTVGFSSRDMAHTKESKKPKFINTSAKCQLYSKGAILYGLDIGKKTQPPLYIFEGYPDYVTAYKHGIKNVCAIGGTALTREHINLIKSLGISDIILALDADDAGRKRTDSLLDEYFGGDETLQVRVQALESGDPDEYIDKHGKEAFLSLPTLTPFQWRLAHFTYEDKPDFICDKMIPIILSDSNEVHRDCMLKELSEKTGVAYKIIRKQLDKQVNADEAKKDGVVQSKIRQLIKDLQYNKGDPATLLTVTAEELKQVNSEAVEAVVASTEVVSFIDSAKKEFENRKLGLQGWKTGYAAFDDAISGIPKQDAMITFAGDSNVGKTGFMFELALRLAKNNDNIMVLFMSIDDSRQQAIARLVALESGLMIRQVSHPIQNTVTEEDREKLANGWASIRKLVDSGKFSLKDNSQGSTLDFAEGWIRWAKENHPKKEICFFLDNFHKLSDERGADERIRFKHASNRIHSMKNKLNITAICTMELRKFMSGSVATRPALQDISESKQMEYDNNLIGMVYSDVHARRHDAKVFWNELNSAGEDIIKPVFEIDIQKNKISEFKDILYYKFSPEHSRFSEWAGSEVDEFRKEYTQAMKNLHDKKNPDAGDNPFKKGYIG